MPCATCPRPSTCPCIFSPSAPPRSRTRAWPPPPRFPPLRVRLVLRLCLGLVCVCARRGRGRHDLCEGAATAPARTHARGRAHRCAHAHAGSVRGVPARRLVAGGDAHAAAHGGSRRLLPLVLPSSSLAPSSLPDPSTHSSCPLTRSSLGTQAPAQGVGGVGSAALKEGRVRHVEGGLARWAATVDPHFPVY